MHAVPLPLPKKTVLSSGCKINFHLDILGRLPNGYHSIKSFMVPLNSPSDTLIISPGYKKGITFACSAHEIDSTDNTLVKAYRLLAQQVKALPDLRVELLKRVPPASGLGGGSANAAELLLFLNRWLLQNTGNNLNRKQLVHIASKIGADVPFFIFKSPAWAYGIGEQLKISALPFECVYIVLVCPKISVNTAWAYRKWDQINLSGSGLTSVKAQVTESSFAGFKLYNCFETVVFATFPQLGAIKRKLLELNAEAALMSGSGSSIFGLFRSEKQADAAICSLKKSGFSVFAEHLYAGASPRW